MKKYGIAVLPGDGIGPEVVAECTKVLKALQGHIGGFELDLQHYDVGVSRFLKTGVAMSDSDFKACRDADGIILGAVGMPSPDLPMVVDKNGTEVSGHVMFRLRFDLDLFAGVRPIKLWPTVPSALAGHENIDIVLVRENTEGLFASYGGGIVLKDQLAADVQIITREGCEKVFDFAFKLAMNRKGRLGEGRLSDGKKVVTCAQKANVFRSFAFFKKVFGEVAQKYAGEVMEDYAFIDALTLWMLQTPEKFDVVVSENAHGDIISDMAAAFVGGMGMAPSGDIGLEFAMFQPAHGTGPTIAGKGIANPTATVLSGKMMLEWLSDKHNDPTLAAAAVLLDKAVYNTFAKGVKTSDIGGTASTSAWGDEVVAQLRALPV
ncbi:MAG: isocitrate/isopropylmalate dehydrogenase family protein [Methylobacteriaceae bacterium]|jgi:3-isopropylmalate dehydrogenase|nr:isocitrate/isopropylmalate dehydrogenase family protein [Methylobacteriaceae bacterium]